MFFFFLDDARQYKPSRLGMGPLVAVGGIAVPGEQIRDLEEAIGALCSDYGFPPGGEFKWSPGQELWMRRNLVGERRKEFFLQILSLIKERRITAMVMITDTTCETATKAASPEMDVIRLFLERAHNFLGRKRAVGVVLADRPTGGRADEDKFLLSCLETLQSGTDYVIPDRIALNVLSAPSKFVRLLQVADVITSCTTARVAGEDRFSPPIFAEIKSLLATNFNVIGGAGLKIHPDYKYANLYHWLLEDDSLIRVRMNIGLLLPSSNFPYSTDPCKP